MTNVKSWNTYAQELRAHFAAAGMGTLNSLSPLPTLFGEGDYMYSEADLALAAASVALNMAITVEEVPTNGVRLSAISYCLAVCLMLCKAGHAGSIDQLMQSRVNAITELDPKDRVPLMRHISHAIAAIRVGKPESAVVAFACAVACMAVHLQDAHGIALSTLFDDLLSLPPCDLRPEQVRTSF